MSSFNLFIWYFCFRRFFPKKDKQTGESNVLLSSRSVEEEWEVQSGGNARLLLSSGSEVQDDSIATWALAHWEAFLKIHISFSNFYTVPQIRLLWSIDLVIRSLAFSPLLVVASHCHLELKGKHAASVGPTGCRDNSLAKETVIRLSGRYQ